MNTKNRHLFEMQHSSIDKTWHTWFLRLPRNAKRSIMVLSDMIMLNVALWSAFALRFSVWWPEKYLADAWGLFVFSPIAGVAIFMKLGLYRAVVRFMSMRLLLSVASGVALLIVANFIFVMLTDVDGMPRSIPLIFGMAAWLYVGGSRLLVRSYYHWLTTSNQSVHKVLIYGAGSAGSQLVHSLNQGQEHLVKGFIDDDASIVGSTLAGIKVYPTKALKYLIEAHNIDAVLLAIPNASREQRRSVLQLLSQFPVHVQSIPSMSEIILGEQIEKLKEIELDDLLGRDVVVPDAQLMSKCILNKSVCVTGAGGSIGSELSRQCIENGAQRLVLFEQ